MNLSGVKERLERIIGNKERLCCIDMCEPVENIQEAEQKIIDEQYLQLHTAEQRNAIIAMAKNMEPEFIS